MQACQEPHQNGEAENKPESKSSEQGNEENVFGVGKTNSISDQANVEVNINKVTFRKLERIFREAVVEAGVIPANMPMERFQLLAGTTNEANEITTIDYFVNRSGLSHLVVRREKKTDADNVPPSSFTMMGGIR